MTDAILEIVDLGDARQETRQLYEYFLNIDSSFIWGIYPDRA